MNTKQFRSTSNGHPKMVRIKGRLIGGRGFRLMSKLPKALSLDRLEHLLAIAKRQGNRLLGTNQG